jgi:hypothetical protein
MSVDIAYSIMTEGVFLRDVHHILTVQGLTGVLSGSIATGQGWEGAKQGFKEGLGANLGIPQRA